MVSTGPEMSHGHLYLFIYLFICLLSKYFTTTWCLASKSNFCSFHSNIIFVGGGKRGTDKLYTEIIRADPRFWEGFLDNNMMHFCARKLYTFMT